MLNSIKNITPVKISKPGNADVFSPWDLEKIATVECINQEDVNSILDVADKAFNDELKYLDKIKRLEILNNAKKILENRSSDFAKIISAEGGKPLKDSIIEVERAINGLELCAEALKKSHGTEIPMGINIASENKIAFTKQFPIGPVLAISAFNHPLNLIVHQVGPAIAAGCPIIIKPALVTPCTCYEFVNLLI